METKEEKHVYVTEYRGRVITNKRGKKDYVRKRSTKLPKPHPLLGWRDGRVPFEFLIGNE